MATYDIYCNGQWYDEIYYDGHWIDQVYIGKRLVWERSNLKLKEILTGYNHIAAVNQGIVHNSNKYEFGRAHLEITTPDLEKHYIPYIPAEVAFPHWAFGYGDHAVLYGNGEHANNYKDDRNKTAYVFNTKERRYLRRFNAEPEEKASKTGVFVDALGDAYTAWSIRPYAGNPTRVEVNCNGDITDITGMFPLADIPNETIQTEMIGAGIINGEFYFIYKYRTSISHYAWWVDTWVLDYLMHRFFVVKASKGDITEAGYFYTWWKRDGYTNDQVEADPSMPILGSEYLREFMCVANKFISYGSGYVLIYDPITGEAAVSEPADIVGGRPQFITEYKESYIALSTYGTKFYLSTTQDFIHFREIKSFTRRKDSQAFGLCVMGDAVYVQIDEQYLYHFDS